MKRLILSTILLLTGGGAVDLGPVKWAVGDAYITECPEPVQPNCMEVVHGAAISDGFDEVIKNTLGRAIDAVAAFFHVAP